MVQSLYIKKANPAPPNTFQKPNQLFYLLQNQAKNLKKLTSYTPKEPNTNQNKKTKLTGNLLKPKTKPLPVPTRRPLSRLPLLY